MKNNKHIVISFLVVICSVIGVYFYSNIDAHQKTVVSSENDIKSDKKEVVADESTVEATDKKADTKDINLNNESKTENKNINKVNNENAKKELTVEEAKNLLINYNSSVDYLYQGDETTFKDVLQDKGYKGYLFLPDVDGDIGFFIDKTNSNIYKFHPSGYMEKI